MFFYNCFKLFVYNIKNIFFINIFNKCPKYFFLLNLFPSDVLNVENCLTLTLQYPQWKLSSGFKNIKSSMYDTESKVFFSE